MSSLANCYRFFRPILWDNGDNSGLYRYSTGATANIVRLCGEYFILTADHCLDKASEGWDIEDCRIPWRIRSEAYCKVGKGVTFSLPQDHENKLIADVRIHKLDGPSCPDADLAPGEYLDLKYLDFTEAPLPRYLSGFPRYAQDSDYEAKELRGTGHIIPGSVEFTSDQGLYKFTSDDLKDIEANGYCGGLVTCNAYGNVTLEGICIQGGSNEDIDFIFFIGVDVLREQLSDAYLKLISKPNQSI